MMRELYSTIRYSYRGLSFALLGLMSWSWSNIDKKSFFGYLKYFDGVLMSSVTKDEGYTDDSKYLPLIYFFMFICICGQVQNFQQTTGALRHHSLSRSSYGSNPFGSLSDPKVCWMFCWMVHSLSVHIQLTFEGFSSRFCFLLFSFCHCVSLSRQLAPTESCLANLTSSLQFGVPIHMAYWILRLRVGGNLQLFESERKFHEAFSADIECTIRTRTWFSTRTLV